MRNKTGTSLDFDHPKVEERLVNSPKQKSYKRFLSSIVFYIVSTLCCLPSREFKKFPARRVGKSEALKIPVSDESSWD